MFIARIYLSLFATLLFFQALAQAPATGPAISQRTLDSISKSSFAKMVSGTDDVANFSNNISFIPTDGKFSLSGNYFFEANRKKIDTTRANRHPKRYYAVNFNGGGSIIGGTIATLFQDAKLNTGVDLGLRFSIRIDPPSVGSVYSDSRVMIEKRSATEFERGQKVDSARNAHQLTALKIRQVNLSITETKNKISQFQSDSLIVLDSLRHCSTNACNLKFTDSLLTIRTAAFKARQKIQSLQQDSIKLDELSALLAIPANATSAQRTRRQRDLTSLYGLRLGLSYEDTVVNLINKEYDDKIYAIENARPVAGIKMSWLSLISNWNRKSYRTYRSQEPFETALQKKDFDGYTAGVQLNRYHFIDPLRQAYLWNVALVVKHTINLDDLTSSELVDEVTIVNGATTRKASTKYDIYVDSLVEKYTTLQLPMHYYRFFSKDLKFGWHAYGQADWRELKKGIYDIGGGFIFGLNSAGAKRLLNIELFVTYKDVTRKLIDDSKTVWQQMQMGLSVAVPFMVYKK